MQVPLKPAWTDGDKGRSTTKFIFARTEHSRVAFVPSERTDTFNQGLSLRYGFGFAKTLSGGSNRASPEGECQGLDGCCSFLSSYGPPAQGTASTVLCCPPLQSSVKTKASAKATDCP